MKTISRINFLTYDEMYELYITKNLTVKELCEMFKVGYKRVMEILKKLNIKKTNENRIKNSINARSKLKVEDPSYGLSENNKNITKENLYDAYIVKDLSLSDCAVLFKTSRGSINRLCKKFSIHKEIIYPKKPAFRKIYKNNKYSKISKDELYELYIIQNKTLEELCEFYNVCKGVILKALRYNNIKKSKEKSEEAYRKAMLKKYEVEHYSKTEEFKIKIENTHLKNCGYKSNFQDPDFKAKIIERNQNLYGVINVSQLEKTKEKIKQNNLEKYGVECVSQLEEVKTKIAETNLKKYGVASYSKTKEFKTKLKETNLKHCGETSNFKTKKFREQSMETCLKKYGFKSPMESEEVKKKVLLAKKANKTTTTSKFEEEIYSLLCKKYSKVERQYRSEKYPFACDFYITELDLYIEYQGHFSHGKEPYDQYNEQHVKKLELWKSKNKNSYKDAINVWTVRDPLKRKTAKENSLNWIEFFTMEQFVEWYNAH